MKLREITVNRFMDALYDYNYEGIDNWDQLYMEYLDLSGLADTKQLELMITMHNLDVRITCMASFINIQRIAIKELKMPFAPGMPEFKKYGHNLIWDADNPQKFLDDLTKIETKEKRYKAEKDTKFKELAILKRDSGGKQDINDRKDFVRKLNALNKAGYTIDRATTDMQTCALMMKEHLDNLESEAQSRSQERR